MILRAVSGLLVALCYAAIVGGVTFLFWRLTNDPRYPGPMIPNNNDWGRIFVVFMMLIAAVVGCIVSLIISLARVDNRRGALIGAGVGLALFLYILTNVARSIPQTPRLRIEMLQTVVFYFVVFPVGLTLTGLGASVVRSKFFES